MYSIRHTQTLLHKGSEDKLHTPRISDQGQTQLARVQGPKMLIFRGKTDNLNAYDTKVEDEDIVVFQKSTWNVAQAVSKSELLYLSCSLY